MKQNKSFKKQKKLQKFDISGRSNEGEKKKKLHLKNEYDEFFRFLF